MSDAKHLNWGADDLWLRLEPLLPGISVEVVARIESTNTRLLDRTRSASGQPDSPVTRPGELDAAGSTERTRYGRRVVDVQPCLLVAEDQILGRGRLGRGWVSRPGASLTFSLSLILAPAEWAGLSLAVGLALAEALDPLDARSAGPRIGLKWPNDLWLLGGPAAGRKLGGILIETVSVGEHRMCVVGIGLNVLPMSVDGLTHGYACLREIDPATTAPAVLALLAEPLARALLAFERDGFAPLVQAYARRDLLLGQAVTTTLTALPEGVAEGVDGHSALSVRCGELHHVVSGEVSVRLCGAET